jgi:hypothetical protein
VVLIQLLQNNGDLSAMLREIPMRRRRKRRRKRRKRKRRIPFFESH